MRSTEVRRVLLDRAELERIVALLGVDDAYLIAKLEWNLKILKESQR